MVGSGSALGDFYEQMSVEKLVEKRKGALVCHARQKEG